MPHLLLEVGCEELPASSVPRAVAWLEAKIREDLLKLGIEIQPGQTYGTPRRLIVGFNDIPAQQSDTQQRRRGPAVGGAFTPEGQPTPALLGFCKGQGVDPADLENDGQYVWVNKHIPGRPTRELLAELLPAAIEAIPFDKTMRWADLKIRFARPIRWILASFEAQVVPFSIARITSGLESRGHRFEHPEPFTATTLDELVAGLRQRRVEPDPQVRYETIKREAAAACTETPDLIEDLIWENAYLTEWPNVLEGTFDPASLELPEPVLVTTMAKHERFFPVRNANGTLAAKFLSVRGGGQTDDVRTGNEWVLRARVNDATFFYREDARTSLDEFLARTDAMTFHAKLGSVRQRADRLAILAQRIAIESGLSSEAAQHAERAGRLAKADLSTGLVGEMDELQGVIGGVYALRQGESEAVSHAIGTQYDLSKNLDPQTDAQRIALCVTAADQLDKLAGYLGLGQAPSGSKDPFGLRRAVSQLIEISWTWPTLPDLSELLSAALEGYASQGVALDAHSAQESLLAILDQRLRSLLESHPYDHVDAALDDPAALLNPHLIPVRLTALSILAPKAAFIQAASRPLNILEAARKKSESLTEGAADQADSSEGQILAEAVQHARALVRAAVDERNGAALAEHLLALQHPIHNFFENTMVMADDPAVRAARLGIVSETASVLRSAGNLSRIVSA